MSKRMQEEFAKLKYKGQDMRFNLSTLVLVLLGSFLIVAATFTQLNFSHYMIDFKEFFTGHFDNVFYLKQYTYVPQIPVLILIAAVLGRKYGTVSVLLYIIAGVTIFPVFAMGGGIKYIGQYNFGYILAYIPALYIAASVLRKGFNIKNEAKASALCVVTVHVIGIMYLVLIAVVRHEPVGYITDFLVHQGGSKFVYDFVFCFCTAIIAKPVKQLCYAILG